VTSATKAVEDRWFALTHLPYEVKIKEINERYDEYIKVIKESNLSLLAQETFIRNANLARDKEIEGVDKLTDAEKENVKQKVKLEDAYKNIKNRILQLKSPREAAIKNLDDEKQRLIELGMAIELVNEWYDAEILKLGEVGEAFTLFESVARTAITSITGYLETQLAGAITGLLTQSKDFEWSWSNFWTGLKNTLIRAVSAMIAKLLVLAALSWLFPWLHFDKGGGVGYDLGGQVKRYQAGGVVDTVPARLTVGEYVIAKPMTDFIRKFKAFPANLIGAISAGMPTPAPAFAGGGLVGSSNVTSTSFGETKIYVDIHDNKISDDVDIKKLAVKVSDEIVRKININRRH